VQLKQKISVVVLIGFTDQ